MEINRIHPLDIVCSIGSNIWTEENIIYENNVIQNGITRVAVLVQQPPTEIVAFLDVIQVLGKKM